MNENTTKRRDWVKNVAIIFLSILLVLTFFSNTIMNYSLPEVATQYVQSGSITAKIRGTGTIEADDPYSLIVNDTRVIESVAVKVGDTVEKGDTIFYLEDKESEELKAAQEELVTLEIAVEQAVLAYESKILDGTISAETIAGVQFGNTNSLEAAQAKVQAAKDKVTSLQNTKAGYEASLANIAGQETLLDNSATYDAATKEAAINSATQKLNEAQAQLDSASENVTSATAKVKELTEWMNGVGSQEAAEQKLIAAEADMQAKQNVLTTISTYYTLWDDGDNVYDDDDDAQIVDNGIFTGDAMKAWLNAYKNMGMSWEVILKAKEADYNAAKEACNAAKEVVNNFAKKKQELTKAQAAKTSAESEQESAAQQVASCSEILKELQSGSTSTDIASKKKAFADQKAQLTVALSTVEAQIAQAQEEQAQVLTDVAGELNLEFQSDEITRAREKVNEKKKEIAKLEEETANPVITAPVSGQITSLSYAAGESTVPGENAAVIQVAGKGFTTSFSVTHEQAKKVSVGDVAELQNSWYYNDLTATLTAIKADPTNPSKNKLLVFEVTGEDVTAGQSISLSVGQKSANYDLIVPNSAIREDNNGKFILIVESKSSPLGTRYMATRVDVEVLASDDTQTAISGALYGYEYVITTATKPVEAGKQVRLPE
ncbi:MAG: HlyD family efflux transporter periplasmic adaptor subunit [Lachnospiraceae bacterium]|nr:HlyD family efflux transporter periplasmic adaptor subunit [Lachnospiraceae bacterium]